MNKELKVINQNGTLTIESRDVALMVDKPHNDLLKSIRTYIEYLGQGNFSQSDFFIESTYLNSQNKEQPCFLLTKKGCDMVANKMTGEKGVLFTAAYVTKFSEMESYIKNNKMLNVFTAEMTTLVDSLVARKIDEIEEKCSKYYRPVSKEKQNIVSYIKKRLGIDKADADYELVKQRVLIKLNADKWEDIPVQTLVNSLNIIDESIRVIKADRNITQMSLFD